MTRKFGLATCFLALVAFLAPMTINFTPRAATMRAMVREMVCVDTTGQVIFLGSTIPINEHLIMTAAHMDCGEYKPLLIDNGLANPLTLVKLDKDHDVMLMSTALPIKGPFAEFRKPVVGEHVNAYGFGLPEITGATQPVYTEGVVSFLVPNIMYTTCQIFPGMSGSGMLGDDGKVIGMVDFVTGTMVGDTVFLPISGAVNGELLEAFLPH